MPARQVITPGRVRTEQMCGDSRGCGCRTRGPLEMISPTAVQPADRPGDRTARNHSQQQDTDMATTRRDRIGGELASD